MSEQQAKTKKRVRPPRSFGWMAEYEDENKLLEAARQVRDAGYTRIDAFTPFPVHGIDKALGIRRTRLPWFSLIAGMTGTVTALALQIWTNAIDYPYIISGKPYISLPAFIPVTFELTVLFAAFMTLFAMLGLNALPKYSNPVFTNPKFDRATDDRFFIWVDSRDKYFNAEKVRELLESTGALAVDEVREDDSPTEVPVSIYAGIAALILITLIPGAIVMNMRASPSPYPRWHVFFDMDFQPSRKAQQPTTIFADGRVQRPPVPGTIARGELGPSDPYLLGYHPDVETADINSDRTTRMVSLFQQEKEEPPAPEPAAAGETKSEQSGTVDQNDASQTEAPATQSQDEQTSAAATEPNYAWLEEFPLPVDRDLIDLGRREFEQNCAPCHGLAGYGDGLVSRRAVQLAEGYWLEPTNLHDPRIVAQPVGRLYYTITKGKGKMAPYADALNPRERWAVVAYIKVLQRSQNARPEDLPPDVDVASLEVENNLNR